MNKVQYVQPILGSKWVFKCFAVPKHGLAQTSHDGQYMYNLMRELWIGNGWWNILSQCKKYPSVVVMHLSLDLCWNWNMSTYMCTCRCYILGPLLVHVVRPKPGLFDNSDMMWKQKLQNWIKFNTTSNYECQFSALLCVWKWSTRSTHVFLLSSYASHLRWKEQ